MKNLKPVIPAVLIFIILSALAQEDQGCYILCCKIS